MDIMTIEVLREEKAFLLIVLPRQQFHPRKPLIKHYGYCIKV